MLGKFTLAAALLILLAGLAYFASADFSVGVKSGDWIEYAVSSTGSPTQGHDVTWARMEVQEVSGGNISVSITSRFSDGSNETTNYTLNLATGHLIDDFIIPAGLQVGDSFPDENLGTVTITSAQTLSYAGAERSVLSASIGNNTYIWDQATGVSLEGTSATSEYTIHTIAQSTNMWSPAKETLGLETIVWVLAVASVFTAVLLVFTAWYIKRKASQRRRRLS
ncbi:MAG: hypothetical protein NWE93_04830 [Candidatus Bathyarchaeota archaeon]|nr:hypothetical protein [Candidatus Bathyarchaeota archaeon]